MLNSLKTTFLPSFPNFLMEAVMGDCGIIFLTYLYDSYDGRKLSLSFEVHHGKIWKGFQILKIWSVPNSCKVIKGNNKGVQDIFHLGTSLMYDRFVIHGVLIYMYII